MRTHFYGFGAVRLFISFIAGVVAFVPALASANTAAASNYLRSHAQNAWAVMALSALGESPDTSFLQTATGTSAIELEAPILALTAAGRSPYTYPATDLIAALTAFYADDQLGDATLVNDDIFGLLALVSASVPSDDPVREGTKAFVLGNQNQDSGWSYSVGGTSDTNTTAAAIMALIASGESPQSSAVVGGVAYLRNAQNSDGGFPYDPVSPWGTGSDAASDAWVSMALSAAGVVASSLSASSTPLEHLLTLQEATSTEPTGYFMYQAGGSEDSFTTVTTSYAVLALLSKTLPVGVVAAPEPSPEPEPAPEEPAAVPAAPQGGGGGPISGPLAVGFQVGNVVATTSVTTTVEEAFAVSTSTASTTEDAEEISAATSTAVLASVVFANDLYYGAQGDDVRALQELLISEGYLAIASSTGWFGPLTRSALQFYQATWGIVPTGIVGPVTRAWLNARLAGGL